MYYKYLTIILIISLTSCLSTSEILEIGRDTYSISLKPGGYRLTSLAREEAFAVGSEKCISLGKHFLFIDESSFGKRTGIDNVITVTFRCLNENDPGYLQTKLSFQRN